MTRWNRTAASVLGTIALLAGLVAAAPAEAQMGVPSPLGGQSIGIHGGLNLSDFIGDDAGDNDAGVGLNAGGSFQVLSFGPVSVGPEIYYAQKKSESRGLQAPGVPTPVTSNFNLSYVEVPLLFKVRLPSFAGGVLQANLQGGPVFGWNLDCDVDLADQTADPEDTCASLLGGDVQSTLEDYEQGYTLGAGLDIGVAPGVGALTLDLRTTQGLSDVIERSSGEDLQLRNRSFSARLGYSFAF